jgi:hypothetical protein
VFKAGKVHEKHDTGAWVMSERMGYGVGDKVLDQHILRYGKQGLQRETLPGQQRAEAIKEARTGQRDVAMSRLNKLFNFDIVVDTQLAISAEDVTSSLMRLARGYKGNAFVSHTGGGFAGKARAFATDLIEDELRQPEDERTGLGIGGALNIANPRLVEQFLQMQVLDMVGGHVDRHEGNFMIDPNAAGGTKLAAIDNDTSFGLNPLVDTDDKIEGATKLPSLEGGFPLVTQAIYDQTMRVNEGVLRSSLAGLLREEQITAACARLKQLKDYFAKLSATGKVIPTLTVEDLTSKPNGSGGYTHHPLYGDPTSWGSSSTSYLNMTMKGGLFGTKGKEHLNPAPAE